MDHLIILHHNPVIPATISPLLGQTAMVHRDFTLRKVKDILGLALVEGGRFLPEIAPVAPSPYLADFLQESLPLADDIDSSHDRPLTLCAVSSTPPIPTVQIFTIGSRPLSACPISSN
jgi:hypothetical protein